MCYREALLPLKNGHFYVFFAPGDHLDGASIEHVFCYFLQRNMERDVKLGSIHDHQQEPVNQHTNGTGGRCD